MLSILHDCIIIDVLNMTVWLGLVCKCVVRHGDKHYNKPSYRLARKERMAIEHAFMPVFIQVSLLCLLIPFNLLETSAH